MNVSEVQKKVEDRAHLFYKNKPKPAEIILGILEEAGEVAKEVALFEQIGNKVNWKRKADKALLAREISQLLVNVFGLASLYEIDVEHALKDLFKE